MAVNEMFSKVAAVAVLLLLKEKLAVHPIKTPNSWEIHLINSLVNF